MMAIVRRRPHISDYHCICSLAGIIMMILRTQNLAALLSAPYITVYFVLSNWKSPALLLFKLRFKFMWRPRRWSTTDCSSSFPSTMYVVVTHLEIVHLYPSSVYWRPVGHGGRAMDFGTISTEDITVLSGSAIMLVPLTSP